MALAHQVDERRKTMTLKQAFFILRHGSAEGEHKYLEAVKVIEDEFQNLTKKAEHPIVTEDPATTIKRAKNEAITALAEETKRYFGEVCRIENMSFRHYIRVANHIDDFARELMEAKP